MQTMSALRTSNLSSLLLMVLLVQAVHGHGRLWDPPSRSSMWRQGFNTLINYDDSQLFCGGAQVQYEKNGGKCGICGDPATGPLDNEIGGKYATGTISRMYKEGQVINITVDLTASHLGWFEFRLCAADDPFDKSAFTFACLNKNLLKEAGTGNTRYMVPKTAKSGDMIYMRFKLPNGVKCRACMLQWKYNAGNSWGVDPVTGQSDIGFGNQEQFYGCADVSIGYDDVQLGYQPSKPPGFVEIQTNAPTPAPQNFITVFPGQKAPVTQLPPDNPKEVIQELEKLKKLFFKCAAISHVHKDNTFISFCLMTVVTSLLQ